MPAPSNPAERSGAAKSKEEEQAEGARGTGRGYVCDQTKAGRAGLHASVYMVWRVLLQDRGCNTGDARQGMPYCAAAAGLAGIASPPCSPDIGLTVPDMTSSTFARMVS